MESDGAVPVIGRKGLREQPLDSDYKISMELDVSNIEVDKSYHSNIQI